MVEFKVNEKVDIIENYLYITDGHYPQLRKYMIHGNAEYKSNGRIVEILLIDGKRIYIVNFINTVNREMQLGYESSNLKSKRVYSYDEHGYLIEEN